MNKAQIPAFTNDILIIFGNILLILFCQIPVFTFFVADFCYGNEDLTFSISEAIKLCVTVVAYAPESFRRYGDILRRHLGLSLFFLSACMFRFSASCVRLQSPDADGAGGPGPLPPAKAEEQHDYNGVGLSC